MYIKNFRRANGGFNPQTPLGYATGCSNYLTNIQTIKYILGLYYEYWYEKVQMEYCFQRHTFARKVKLRKPLPIS